MMLIIHLNESFHLLSPILIYYQLKFVTASKAARGRFVFGTCAHPTRYAMINFELHDSQLISMLHFVISNL